MVGLGSMVIELSFFVLFPVVRILCAFKIVMLRFKKICKAPIDMSYKTGGTFN